MNDRLTQQTRTRSGEARVGAREFVVAESPIPQQRALTAGRPLALVLGGSATVMAIWFLAVIGSAGMAATGGAAVVMQGSVPNTQRDTTINVPNANIIPQNPQNKPSPPPPLLQSRSADTLPPLTARSDGRTALRASPSVLVVYVPDGYYPPPQSAQPPTKEAAQQTANIVQELATGNETKAVEQAKVLQAAQPQYAKTVAVELQTATQDSPRYNVVRQTLIALDPALATRAQAQTQTQTQAQTQVQAQPQTQSQPQTSAPSQAQTTSQPSRPNPTDTERAARVNALVMSTVPAFAKIPFGLNEGTLQVNTLVAPTPAYLFDQAQIKQALCEIGRGEVVAVHDTIPDAWELKTTFTPKDPVRWFTVKDASGKLFYLPNYVDPVRDMQVGDRYTNKGGCNVELVKR